MKKVLLKKVNKIKRGLIFFSVCIPAFLFSQNTLTIEPEAFTDSLKFLKRLVYSSDNPKQSQLDNLIDTTLLSFMQSPQNCGISIGIYKEGSSYFYNYGEVKRDSKKLPQQNTIYEIGAISTTFCGLLLATAVIEGKIKLEDDIRKYLPGKYPDLMYVKTPVRIKHLVNHTSGLPRIPGNISRQPDYDSLNPYKHYTRQQIFDYLKVVKIKQEPGTVCDYSNLGMALLGLILEEIYNKNFEDLVKEKIAAPNKMINTCVHPAYLQVDYVAQGYNENGDLTPAWDLGDFAAAGALRSSTEDMLRYLEYNLQEKDAAVKLAQQPTFIGRESLAFAWFIKRTKSGNTLFWHNGATFGFSSFCGFIKEKNCSVVILSDSGMNVDYIAIAILNFLQR